MRIYILRRVGEYQKNPAKNNLASLSECTMTGTDVVLVELLAIARIRLLTYKAFIEL